MIGSHLAAALRDRGDEVTVLTHRTPGGPDEVRWDPVRGVQQLARLEGLDAVVNLTGAALAKRPWTRARREELRTSRVEATEGLLRSLSRLDAPPGVFVGVSSLGLFGDRGDDVIDDDDPPGQGWFAEMCAAWEAVHLRAEEELGARAAVLRMSVVLSHTGGAFPLMVRPFHYVGGWLGNGKQFTPWISIRDAVRALVHLVDEPGCKGGFNGTVPDPMRNKEWCRALGRAMHRPVVTHAPKWALRGALGDLADSLFLASVRAVPRKLRESGFEFLDTDAEETFVWLIEQLREGGPTP